MNRLIPLALASLCPMTPASAQMTSVRHIILVNQENRQIAGDVMRRQRFRWVRVVMAVVAFVAVTIESASARQGAATATPCRARSSWTAAAKQTSTA